LLEARLKALTAGTLFDDFNVAVAQTLEAESRKTLVAEIVDAVDGFTMINSGFITSGAWEKGWLLDVTDNLIKVDGVKIKDESVAKGEAEKDENRATLKNRASVCKKWK